MFRRGEAEVGVRHVPLAVLRENLSRAVEGVRAFFEELAEQDGPLPLKEAQISFGVTATGGITLVGTTAQVSGTGTHDRAAWRRRL
ncbi:MAG: Pepco domain-containing protein [Frankia sp.]